MPERSCNGCVKQKQWGCTATKLEVPAGTKGAVPDQTGKRWFHWTNPAAMPLTFDGERTYACPRQSLKRDPRGWSKLFKYYGMYKAGFLPQAGAVVDQSAKAVELFRILDNANAEADESLRAKPPETRQKGRPGR